MRNDVVYLGSAPAGEDCAQVGSADYQERARAECLAYAHDFGNYFEVVCEYDGDNPDAANYAARCDGDAPTTWAAAGMTPPGTPPPGLRESGKRYVGTRTPDECVVVVVNPEGGEELLDLRHDLRKHSAGFNWGFGGSGPAQLALALLADALGDDERARRFYQDFKFKVIARIDDDAFALTQTAIEQTVARLEAERGNKR